MQNTLEELSNHFAIHWSPFLLLIAPLYRIFESPYLLLWIQTIALALGAWPLYLFAKKILQNNTLALFITASYLLYPSLHWVNIYDFHEIAFLPALLLAALYFIERGSWKWAIFFLLFAASTKEDAILIVAFVGVWLLVKELKWFDFQARVGAHAYSRMVKTREGQTISIFIIIIFLLYFFIIIKILMPAFGGGLLRIDRYAYLGSGFTDIARNLIVHPSLFIYTVFTKQKLIYLFWIFAPVAFLPFFAPQTLILLIPGLLENLLTNYAFQFQGMYQYDAVLITGIFVGTIYGLHHIITRWPHYAKKAQWIFIFFVAIAFLVRSPISPILFPMQLFKSNPHWDTMRALVRLTPPHISIAANTNLVPHLAEREHIYMLGREPFPVDMILIDGADLFGFASPDEFQTYADRYALSRNYKIQTIQNRYFVFIKNGI